MFSSPSAKLPITFGCHGQWLTILQDMSGNEHRGISRAMVCTLILPFGNALNLDIPCHMLFLDGDPNNASRLFAETYPVAC